MQARLTVEGKRFRWPPPGTLDTACVFGENRSAVTFSDAKIGTTLSQGSLFELTWHEDGSTRTALVVKIPFERPSAKPLQGPTVFRFDPIGIGDPFRVAIPDIEAAHPIDLASLPPAMIANAAESLKVLAEIDVAQISIEDVRVLINEAESEETSRVTVEIAAEVLEAEEHPPDSLVEPLTELLAREGLTGAWDDAEFARPATRCLVYLADDPPAVFDLVPHLAIAAELEDRPTRRAVLYILSRLASEYPEEVLPLLDVLVDGIANDDENCQQNALSALGRIVQSYPDAAEPIADEVAQLFDSNDPRVRGNAVGLFGDLSVEHQAIAMRYGPELLGLLEDEAANVRRHASIALLRAGEADPDVFRSHAGILEDALADDVTEVRRNVCSIVGNEKLEVDVERLEQLARHDPDEVVRERAGWAVDRLR